MAGILSYNLQYLVVLIIAESSAAYVMLQDTAIDVLVSALTLTFLSDVDEQILACVMFFSARDAFGIRIPETWRYTRRVRVPSSRPFRVKVADVCRRMMFLLVPLCVLFFYSYVVSGYHIAYFAAPTGGNCSRPGLENFAPITTKYFCEHAARSLGLEDKNAEGEGVCMYNYILGNLFLGRNSAAHGMEIQVICQPEHIVFEMPISTGILISVKFLHRHSSYRGCGFHQMLDIENKSECQRALSSIRSNTMKDIWDACEFAACCDGKRIACKLP